MKKIFRDLLSDGKYCTCHAAMAHAYNHMIQQVGMNHAQAFGRKYAEHLSLPECVISAGEKSCWRNNFSDKCKYWDRDFNTCDFSDSYSWLNLKQKAVEKRNEGLRFLGLPEIREEDCI